MRIFCKGFNLYNQLNEQENCIAEFQPAIEDDYVNCFLIKHSFSLLLSKSTLKMYCKCAPKHTIDLENIKVVQISANDSIVLILDEFGQVFKSIISNLQQFEPLPKFTEDNDKIKFISCGSKLNIAYTENGLLYSIPGKLDFVNPDVLDVQTGKEHCLLLDRMGNIYTFGRGSRGQLGHGQLDDESRPRLVEALAGIRISSIATGGWHSAAVSQDGDLYTWGWNGNGQLGLSNIKDAKLDKLVSVMATPHIIDIDSCSDKTVIQVACGSKHTILLLDNNTLYGSGWNQYKQLKNEAHENYYSFVFLHDFSNENVRNITCGPWNSAVICK